MSSATRRLNRTLARTLQIQVVRADRRPVVLGKAWLAQLIHFNRLLESVSGINGDVVECGVASGSTLAMLASLTAVQRQSRRLWGFDSWAGLPQPSRADLESDASIATPGMFAHASTMTVRDELRAFGMTDEEIAREVKLVPGWFSETLPTYSGRIALLHIDVDLYESYLDCLQHLWPSLEIGGVVAFDEYGEPDRWPGAKRAVDEFLQASGTGASELHCDAASGKWWVQRVGA
jgi:hypothetical protein